MTILIGMAAAIIVIAAFCLGIFAGQYFGNMKALKLARQQDIIKTERDEEQQRRYEEDLKAFEDTMKYSLDIAYGNNEKV